MTYDAEIFTCTQCGDCCKGFGGTYLAEIDVMAIADYLGISKSDLLERYCVLSGNRPVLAQAEDGYCIFFDFFDQNCSIHPVKPRMCKKWPYIESVLKDPANWRIMAAMCPGMQRDADPSHVIRCVRSYLDKNPP
jgi:Fe-S-cluster containining protein